MWLPAITTTPPAQEPVSLAEVKQFLRIDADETGFDAEIGAIIAGVRADVERITGTRLITQVVQLTTGSFDDLARLPIGPVQDLISIYALDTMGVEQLLDPADTVLFGGDLAWGIRAQIGASWPVTSAVDDAVRVSVRVGYGNTGANVPEDLRIALLRAARAQFDDKPFDIETQLVNRRIWG